MTRFSNASRHRSPRRPTSWEVGVNAVEQAISATSNLIWTNAVTSALASTLVRIRGYAFLRLEVAGAGDGFEGALAIGLVSNEAVAAGAAAVPNPLTDANFDGWIWHHFFDVHSVTATIADGVNANAVVQRIEIDSKAMRIWDGSGYTLIGVMGARESGTVSLVLGAETRILVKT